MHPDDPQDLLRRLRTADGHLRGVIAMLEEGQSCEQVLHQLLAVQAALRTTGCCLIEQQMQSSIEIIRDNDSPEVRTQALERLVRLYQMASKTSTH